MTKDLLSGLKRFRKDYFPGLAEHYRALVEKGQSPTTLFIGCSDSRILPSLLTGAAPGDLFVVRNIGNIVPPYEESGGHHGVSAAIEYAVLILGVRDIVVCGHSHCAAIRALYDPPTAATRNIRDWLEIAAPARLPGPMTADLLRRTEERSIILQLDRLMDFPVVRARVESGEIALHGWHYAIEDGTVRIFEIESGEFRAVPG